MLIVKFLRNHLNSQWFLIKYFSLISVPVTGKLLKDIKKYIQALQ